MRATTFGLVLVAMLASSAVAPAGAAGSDPAAFDGAWDVIAVCPPAGSAMGYTLQFTAEVKGGVLHGVYGTAGQASSLTLDGPIQPDGTAKFAAKGLTGNAVFTGGQANQVPYAYDVTATFKGSRGIGSRVGGTRTCNYSFQRH